MSIVSARWTSSIILFISTIVVSVVPVIIFNYFLKKKRFNVAISMQNTSASSTNDNVNSTASRPSNVFDSTDEINLINKENYARNSSKSAAILQIFMFFGGGVLLATCFCHLIPEVKENFEKYLHRKETNHTNFFDLFINQNNDNHLHHNHGHTHHHSVPFVEIAICCGFFLIYFLEEIVHSFLHKHQHQHSFKDTKNSLNNHPKRSQNSHLVNENDKKNTCYDNNAVDYQTESQLDTEDNYSNINNANQISSIDRSCVTITNDQPFKSNENLLPASVRFIQGLVTIGAFSAHSIFDGLAIGLQSSENQIYTMLFAISMHKFVVAFAVALELFDQTSSLWMTSVHMSIFSIMSPIGIWIVIFSQSGKVASEDESLVLIMLSAIATGTIIYIVFFEILQKDRSSSKVNGIFLWFIMVIGFVLMLLINIFIAE